MGEATWCFDGEKYPAAVNRFYYAMYRACLALLVGEERVPVKHTRKPPVEIDYYVKRQGLKG